MASARSYRFAWQPKWLAGHLLVAAAVITMVLLGRWQLSVSDRKHFSLQNFGYALQWWAFSLFAIAFWVKITHDTAIGRESTRSPAQQPQRVEDQPVAYRRYVMPNRTEPDSDPAIAAYNAYLASLAAHDAMANDTQANNAQASHALEGEALANDARKNGKVKNDALKNDALAADRDKR